MRIFGKHSNLYTIQPVKATVWLWPVTSRLISTSKLMKRFASCQLNMALRITKTQ